MADLFRVESLCQAERVSLGESHHRTRHGWRHLQGLQERAARDGEPHRQRAQARIVRSHRCGLSSRVPLSVKQGKLLTDAHLGVGIDARLVGQCPEVHVAAAAAKCQRFSCRRHRTRHHGVPSQVHLRQSHRDCCRTLMLFQTLLTQRVIIIMDHSAPGRSLRTGRCPAHQPG